MKKYFLFLSVFLLAAGCNINSQTSVPAPSNNQTAQSQNPPVQNNKVKADFACKDLFPDGDFKSIIKQDVSVYKLDEGRHPTSLDCSYTPADLFNIQPPVYFRVEWGSNIQSLFNTTKATFGSNKPVPAGIGSDAYYFLGGLDFMSTNKKFLVNVNSASGHAPGTNAEIARVIDRNLDKY